MPKNQFSPLNELPDENDFIEIVPNFGYKRIYRDQLPKPIIDNGLVDQCNSFILASSGSTECMVYSIVCIRPDKGNVIDEHPFVFYYDHNNPSNNFGGIIHHGDWEGRTVPMEIGQFEALARSGITADFTYKSIPPGSSGSLWDLRANGMLNGISKQFDILYQKRQSIINSVQKKHTAFMIPINM